MIVKRLGVVVSMVMCWRLLLGCCAVFAQQPADHKPAVSPLVRLLQDKGILTEEEVARIDGASSPADAEQQLARLLLTKGIITQGDYDRTFGATMVVSASAAGTSSASMIPAVYRVPLNSGASVEPAMNVPSAASPAADQGAAAPTVIPAITPPRVFPVGGLTKGEMKAAFSMGNLHVTPYGFIKATLVRDSSSPGGDDFPLPGFLPGSDTGPQGAPEFHVKARSSRLGANFEWMDPSPNLTVTGKIEADFEGDFTRVDNRNLSSVRSSMPSIRLAYMRLDYKFGEKDTFSALFGQDWTPFTSSTLPTLVETMLSGGRVRNDMGTRSADALRLDARLW